jgi:adenosylhomocysteine nucleosidase
MANSRPLLGIVTALPAEARCLGVRTAPVGEPVTLADQVLVVRCGIGRARASRAALDLLQAGAGALMSWGTAAGLSPELEHGDLVLARDVVSRDGHHFGADPAWHQRLWEAVASKGRCFGGGLAEADGVLVDADDKLRTLFARTVSATVAVRIPASALAALDANGDVAAMRCLARLAGQPADLPALLRLATGFRAACARLARLAALAGPHFLCGFEAPRGRAQA